MQPTHSAGILMALALIGSVLGCRATPSSPAAEVPPMTGVSDGQELEFLVLGMSCESCSRSAMGALEKGIPEAQRVSVDFATKKGRVVAPRRIGKDQVREALGTLGFEAQFPDDPPRRLPVPEEVKTKLDVKMVSRGDAIRIEDHLAPGKYTIFDYFADWCGPCHLLTPKLERFVQESATVALRKVDTTDWESEAAKQATKDFKLPGFPYVRVYGPDGSFVGAVPMGGELHQGTWLLSVPL